MIDAQRVDFVTIPTRDRDRAVKFYGETPGLTRNPSSSERWVEFETGNLTLAIVVPEEIGKEFAPLPFGALAIRVLDVDAAKEKLQQAGVEFAGETFDSGVCNGAIFTDPDGNGLMLHRRYAPYADGSQP